MMELRECPLFVPIEFYKSNTSQQAFLLIYIYTIHTHALPLLLLAQSVSSQDGEVRAEPHLSGGTVLRRGMYQTSKKGSHFDKSNDSMGLNHIVSGVKREA